MIGVYKITNTVDGKVYIGSTFSSMKNRWRKHTIDLNRGNHHNHQLQNDWNLFGKSAFAFEVLEVINWTDGLRTFGEREQYWLDQYKASGCETYNHHNVRKTNRPLGVK
jgi:group I intron endonuclease